MRKENGVKATPKRKWLRIFQLERHQTTGSRNTMNPSRINITKISSRYIKVRLPKPDKKEILKARTH